MPGRDAETYSYLGPAGTFTWAALGQVPGAAGKAWRSVNNVGEALDDVVSGRSVAAMIAIENSIEGGVSATQDALASIPNLRILGEYLVPVDPTASKTMQGNITVGVRPEAWRVVGNSEAGLPVQVTVVEDLGSDAYVYGHCDVEGTPNNIIIRVSGRDHPLKGETMYVTTDPKNVHVFDTESGDRLSD